MGSDDRDTIKPALPQVDAASPTAAHDDSVMPIAHASQSILVLGMHRSGTSAVARVLGAMGAHIGEPDELLPAHAQDNPTGYWERTELVIEHDRFFAATGYAWDRVAGFDSHRLDADACKTLSARLQQVIGKLKAVGNAWLVKDPRLCLLLPQWLPLLDDAACVIVVRDPREIAASLRASHRGVYTSDFVLALWEKYLQTMLADLRGRRALFVSYSSLLADVQGQSSRMLRGLRELGVTDLREPSAAELAAFLDVRLRRSAPKAHVELTATQDALDRWLESKCLAGGAVSVSDFPSATAADALLAEFQASFDFHLAQGRTLAGSETSERLEKIENRLAEHRRERESQLAAQARERESQLVEQARERERWLAELAAQRQLTEQAQIQSAEQRRLTEQAQGLLTIQHQLTDKARRQLDLHRQRLAQAQVLANSLTSKLADTKRERDERQQTLLRQATDVHERNLEIARLSTHAIALADQARALRTSWSWKVTAPLRGVAGLFRKPASFGMEQHLYRWYYSMPGLGGARKRGLILWLHEHAAWLTRRTLSYQLYARSREAAAPQAASGSGAARMDEQGARSILAAMTATPCISIVMPVYNVEQRWLLAAVNSVRQQFYPHWELCIADDASTLEQTRKALDEIARIGDSRIKLQRLRKNVGIAGASNAALQLASGDYVGLLDNDDTLTRDALLVMAQEILAHSPDILYSDEDKLDVDGRHVDAHFKSDFNLDYFLSINYLCHFTVMRRSLIERIGGFRAGFEGAQDYDLFLRATEKDERVRHVPQVLYHWRMTPASTAMSSSAKPKSWEAGQRALSQSLERRQIGASAEPGPYPNTFRVRRAIAGQPLVSILLPFRDKPELLATCIHSILEKTDYPQFEILGIDNGSVEPASRKLMRQLEQSDSRIRFVSFDAPFNYSSINNFGARHARGEHLLMLNNDTEIIAAEWLRAMLEHSQRPEVGVVGAKLLYSDTRIQHAGVIIGIGGVAGHAHLLLPCDQPGYFSRAQLQQNLSAVTFACAMTRRDVFAQLGGLNERDLTIAFNDIDYCLRAREAGYLVVYTPHATLYHHESKTRGYEDNPEKQARFFQEITYMKARHQTILQHGDPYYNPNLRLDTHDFSALPGYVDALPR